MVITVHTYVYADLVHIYVAMVGCKKGNIKFCYCNYEVATVLCWRNTTHSIQNYDAYYIKLQNITMCTCMYYTKLQCIATKQYYSLYYNLYTTQNYIHWMSWSLLQSSLSCAFNIKHPRNEHFVQIFSVAMQRPHFMYVFYLV